jgi:hypothetical protein
MGCLLGDRTVMLVEEVPDGGIAADQDELPRSQTGAERLEQPEHSLDRDIHYDLGHFLAGREMDNMSDAGNRRCSTVAIGDSAGNHLQPVAWLEHSLMTQGAQPDIGISRLCENAVDKVAPHFPGRTGDEKQHGFGPDCGKFGGRVLAMRAYKLK